MNEKIENTRYTATLPVQFLDDLKILVKEKKIPSVNYAIKQALDEYLKQIKRQQYENMMKEAAKDEEFISRTMKCADDFKYSDSEVPGEW